MNEGGGTGGDGNQKAGLIGYFARNHVAANVLMLLLLGGGLFAASQVAIERYPEYDPGTITVTVPYPGAAPAEVAEDITRRVEESIAGIVGVQRVVSSAAEGIGKVSVEMSTFADAADVLDAVKTAVERIENFPPPNAEQPEILRTEVLRHVLTLTVSAAHLDEDGLRREAEALRAAVLALPGVSVVSLQGARDREIGIELSEEALRRHGLTINAVASAVRQSSFNLSGGELRTDAGEVLIGTFAQRATADEFKNIVLVARPDGSVVTLDDVATLRDGFVEENLLNEQDGRAAVFVRIDAAVGQSTQAVGEEVKRFLAGYAPAPGTDVFLWQDENRLIFERLSIIARNAVIGAVLVFLALLAIFDLRIAFWIAMGIPIAFLGSILFFDASGMSINALTMFAFFIVAGLVVDDAVVVGESIARQRELGQRGVGAAIAGVRAVAGPVVVGALTTAVAFFALFPLDDALGQLFAAVSVVVALVLAVSLLEVFCILPAHLARDRPWSLSPLADWQRRTRSALDEFIHGKVVRAIAWAVRFPYLTLLAVAVSMAMAAALLATDVVRFTAFPESTGSERSQANLTMPIGTQFEVTAAAARHLAAAAHSADHDAGGTAVESVVVLVGQHRLLASYDGARRNPAGDHLATVEVKLNPAPLRTVSESDFRRLWRRAAGEIPGARTISFDAAAALFSTPVSHALLHDDEIVLAQAVADLKDAYHAVDAMREVHDSLAPGKRRYDIQLTEAGIAAGLTAAQVAGQLHSAFFGVEAQRIQRGHDEIRVMVRYPGERRRSLRDLLDERIVTPTGSVPLATVARITETQDYAEVLRIDRQRAATLVGWFDAKVAGSRQVVGAIEQVFPALLTRYPGLEIRKHGATRDNAATLATLAWSFPLALLVVYGLLASQLRSFAQPLLALASLPMVVFGAVVGHLVLGYDMTNASLFGIVAITGVAVNDTLILLDRYNRIRAADANLPAVAAIAAAARHRARAIVLTTVTTGLGLLPLLYDKSDINAFLVPMVISLGAGLVFASIGVLLLVPAVLIVAEMVWFSPLFRVVAQRRRATANPLGATSLLLFAALPILLGCGGPVGPIAGGALSGSGAQPPAQWRSVPEAIQLEVRPTQPYSVNVWSVGIGPYLYVATGAEGSTWTGYLQEDRNVRVRVDGVIYALRAVVVGDAEERRQAVAAYMKKYASPADEAEGFAPIRRRREAAMHNALSASDGLLYRLEPR